MKFTDSEVAAIVKDVVAKLNLSEPKAELGIFDDMNVAIAAAKEAQAIVRKMPLDAREKVIANIRKKTIENAEILARMGVEETGMGNVGHKILKHKLTAEMTPGTEDITTTAWSGDKGLTLIEMGPFGVIGAITPCTNPSETVICNTIGTPNWMKPAIQTEYYVKTGLVIMGAEVLFSNISNFICCKNNYFFFIFWNGKCIPKTSIIS